VNSLHWILKLLVVEIVENVFIDCRGAVITPALTNEVRLYVD
jgi:hypothetical protein